MRIIAGDELVLEPQRAEHAQAMFVVLSDPAIYEYENDPPPSVEWLHKRFGRLESRRSSQGDEQWLNWVIRLPTSELAGYVQATIAADGHAAIAYVLASRYWGRGLARRAVQAMNAELAQGYEVHTLTAVLKQANLRSLRLLERLGFTAATAATLATHRLDADEMMMQRDIRPGA